MNKPSNNKKEVLAIINNTLPNAEIYAFGSRVDGSAKKYSDLDISINLGKKNKIPLALLSKLEEDFNNSDILFKVDLVDFQRVCDEFQKIILSTGEKWQ